MSDLQQYKNNRMAQDPEFWKNYEEKFETFKLGILLKQARIDAGMTQEQIAKELSTTKSVISRMENHAKDYTRYSISSLIMKCLRLMVTSMR